MDDSDGQGPEPDWTWLLERAGLDTAGLSPARPKWNPPFATDVRQAWEGTYPDRPDVRLRVEAGAWRGKPVFFEIVTPWKQASGTEDAVSSPGQTAGAVIMLSLLCGVLGGGVVLARRNVRLGRGDRRSAFRLGLIVFCGYMGQWTLAGHHEPTLQEVGLFFEALVWSLFFGAAVWMVYIALEPYVRRVWPDLIISWNRLLHGRLRDPMIGRDTLIGALTGVGASVLYFLLFLLPEWLGQPRSRPAVSPLQSLAGIRHQIGDFFNVVQRSADR